ncbi:golgi uridine diphosphate-N- acetylglucosamine transporter [Gamsiella multidivaricata]|nr:golgi uridine diphosphate-N- acetylglucosamine transporter [Gamsiella multidivaricata]
MLTCLSSSTVAHPTESMESTINGPVRAAVDSPSSELRHRSHEHPKGAKQQQERDDLSLKGPDTRTGVAEKDPLKHLPPKRSVSWSSWAAITLQASIQDWILIATMIFGGCCSNVFALEILVNDAPKSGQMITFAQFICVSLYGLFMHVRWPIIQELFSPNSRAKNTSLSPSASLTLSKKNSPATPEPQPTTTKGVWRYIPHLKPRRIPLIRWLAIVIMFFSVSVLNNWSLAYKISVPLHIIFRSGGLMVGMVLGMILMKKRYSRSQMLAVLIVTIGVIYATTSANTNNNSSSSSKGSSGSTQKGSQDTVNAGDYAIGVVMLTVALIVSSLMGLLQESTYQTYGAEWREGLFYSHFLALPMFILFYSDIMDQIQVFNRSTPIPVLQLVRQIGPYLPTSLAYRLSFITIPRLWIFLAVNTLTQ